LLAALTSVGNINNNIRRQ